ncbi:MAG: beta-lactamase family protein, partial [Crocinitomicaceae bacterium]|nr:beta-lactamase family protein [Crocinitomicaceae bacterium]
MIRTFLFQLICIFSLVNCYAQELSNGQDLDDFIKNQIDKKNIAGAVVMVCRNGETVTHKAYGNQDLQDKIAMDTSSIFRIFSMTKPITSLATIMLVDRDSLSLDDPIEMYIPELKDLMVLEKKRQVKSKGKITVRDLLRHTSGFAYGLGLGDSKVDKLYDEKHPLFVNDNDQMVERLSGLPLQSNPGEKYNYSISVDVLGCIIERVSGMSLAEFFKANLFEPLGMNDTHFKLPESKINRLCSYYEKDMKLKESYKETVFTQDRRQSGGGGLVSTSSDYMKFCKLLLNNGIYHDDTLVSPSLIAQMTLNQLPEGEGVYKIGNEVGIGFGLGFMVHLKEWGRLGHLGDYGWSGIGSTHFYVSPKEDLIVII